MSQPANPFQRQPVPPPGSIRRDTPNPLPEPQIWAAVASVGALFAFFGTILPWFLPKPSWAGSGGALGWVPTWAGGLALIGVLSLWMLSAPTMRLRGAYAIATSCIVCGAGAFAFAFAHWVARQSLLANEPPPIDPANPLLPEDPAAVGVDHGNPLLGMWLFLIAALFALVLGVAALVRLKAGPPAPSGPPGRGGRWNPAPTPPEPLGPGQPAPGGPHNGAHGKPELVRPFRGRPVNVVLPPYRDLSQRPGGVSEPADQRILGAPRGRA